jgi:hypothetical protein
MPAEEAVVATRGCRQMGQRAVFAGMRTRDRGPRWHAKAIKRMERQQWKVQHTGADHWWFSGWWRRRGTLRLRVPSLSLATIPPLCNLEHYNDANHPISQQKRQQLPAKRLVLSSNNSRGYSDGRLCQSHHKCNEDWHPSRRVGSNSLDDNQHTG